jgi:CheY-like chemotaxis protein
LPDWVAGDRLRLEQVLLNLLGNAVKFTAHGEVSLNVRREGEDTLFRVADSGIGMTPEQVSRLFSAFEQADSSTTRQFGGSGLGLAISRNLAHLMGGDIGVTSEMGNGSVFTLQLPLPTATPQKKAEIAVASGPRLAGLRVLAAEDVELNRLVLEDFLEHEGAVVVFAENGEQVLARLNEHGVAAFDVVLMDVQMPVMDGHEATRRLRAIAPNLPVIGLTAHALAEERDKCLASGMVEHVGKPIEPDELIGAILRQVGGWVASVESAASAAIPAAEASSSLIDWAALNERFNNRTAFIDKLLATVLKDHAPTPVNLRLAVRAGDFKTLAFLAHSLKGLTGSLSAQAIYAQSRTAEDAARLALENAAEETLEVARQAAEILAEQMDALLQEITLHLEPPANDLPEATA